MRLKNVYPWIARAPGKKRPGKEFFSGKKGDFGEISVKEAKNSCCAVPVLKLYQHILNRFL